MNLTSPPTCALVLNISPKLAEGAKRVLSELK
jgi:hypothetical protein